jgi:parvulin-like peptidyl-prolyl isomerase
VQQRLFVTTACICGFAFACNGKTDATNTNPLAASDSGVAEVRTTTTGYTAFVDKRTKKGQLKEINWPDGPIARVNGVEVPKSKFDKYYNRFRMSMHKFPILYPEGGEIAVMARVGKRVVTEEILRQQAKKQKIKISEEMIASRLEEIEDRMKRDADYADHHRMLGTTKEDFRAEAEIDAIREELLYQGLKDAKTVPEAELKALYESRKEQFKHPDQVKVKRIRFDIGQEMTGDHVNLLKQKAETVLASIKKGAKFEDMARTMSEGSSRERGGDLGWISRIGLSENVVKALWTTKPGGVTDVLQDERGLYIYKVEGFRKPGYAPLEDVRAMLFLELQKTRQEAAINKIINEWRSSAEVEVLIPELASAMTHTSTVMPEIPERDPSFEGPTPKSAGH